MNNHHSLVDQNEWSETIAHNAGSLDRYLSNMKKARDEKKKTEEEMKLWHWCVECLGRGRAVPKDSEMEYLT